MAATPKPVVTSTPKTRISPLDTKARDAQAKAAASARAKAYQDQNNPALMTPAQKAAYLANPGRSNY
jgi:hypothetical protein